MIVLRIFFYSFNHLTFNTWNLRSTFHPKSKVETKMNPQSSGDFNNPEVKDSLPELQKREGFKSTINSPTKKSTRRSKVHNIPKSSKFKGAIVLPKQDRVEILKPYKCLI